MDKQTVHNELEGKVLIKDAFRNGDEAKYDGCNFYSHGGEFLFTAKVRLTEFEMDRIRIGQGSTTIEIV